MASRTPEFGKWDDEDVPYSQVFDKARKNRADRKTNQDCNQNDNLPKSPKHDARRSPTDSPLRPATSPYYHHHHHRNAKQSVGSDRGFDHHSPLMHPQQHKPRGSSGLVGVSSPAKNEIRKGSSEGSHSLAAPSTPGRSRLRQIVRGDGASSNQSKSSSSVPKFGDWDENDPTAAEGLTAAFEMVGKERQNTEPGRVPTKTTDHYSQPNRHHQHQPAANKNSKKCCCFPW